MLQHFAPSTSSPPPPPAPYHFPVYKGDLTLLLIQDQDSMDTNFLLLGSMALIHSSHGIKSPSLSAPWRRSPPPNHMLIVLLASPPVDGSKLSSLGSSSLLPLTPCPHLPFTTSWAPIVWAWTSSNLGSFTSRGSGCPVGTAQALKELVIREQVDHHHSLAPTLFLFTKIALWSFKYLFAQIDVYVKFFLKLVSKPFLTITPYFSSSLTMSESTSFATSLSIYFSTSLSTSCSTSLSTTFSTSLSTSFSTSFSASF